MKLSVVVPIHNEAENIYSVADEICRSLDGRHDYELIFVDDGSADQTGTVLCNLQKEFPKVRTVRHVKCCGQSAAISTGVKNAVNPVIITLDGDNQNDPADIERLLETYNALPEHACRTMVTGFRRIRHDTVWRRLSSKFANAVRSRILRDQTSDTGCGLKVFPRELFLSLPYFDHMHRFLPALVKRTDGKVISVEISHRPRKHGRSHYGTLDRLGPGVVDLIGVMWLMKRAGNPEIERISMQNDR